MQKQSIKIFSIISILFFLCAPSFSLAAGDERILFLHHSTGAGVWSGGGVSGWFSSYNSANGTTYQISERSYPDSPYSWANYSYDYWNLWANGACDSGQAGIECLNTLTQNKEVLIFKHCYPGADVLADTGSPDVSSSRKSLENYKLQYRALRAVMDAYPNDIFIVWTLAPLHRLATTSANAARAKQFVDWVNTDFLTEDAGSHPNIYIFDFWGLAADTDNFLKYEYEGSHSGSDSHPNALANQTIGPLFAQTIVDATIDFDGQGDTVAPAAPSGLSVQ